jgi:hypothetical protein
VVPYTASGRPVGAFRFVVTDAGDQTEPSIDGEYVVYAGPGPLGSGTDVLLYDTEARATRTIAGGPGEQRAPDLWGRTAIFLAPNGVAIRELQPEQSLRAPAGDGLVRAPAIGSDVAAWELGQRGSRDIRVSRYRVGVEYTLSASDGSPLVGDQFAPSAWGTLVGWVEGQDRGAVRVHDSATGTSRPICDGEATGLSIGHDGSEVVVAVARASLAHDADIEVYDLDRNLLAALRVPGVQQNPHLSRDWVAFEDVSTELSQVVLWNWTTGLVFVPHPTRTRQILNDLSFVFPEEVRVVFEDTASAETGRDIALYVLDVYPGILFDDQPNGYPFETDGPPTGACDPASPALATLRLAREVDRPEADQVDFQVDLPDGTDALPVVVCIEAEHVSAAWVMLDDVAVASPSDFEPSVVSLARPGTLGPGMARISGVIAGKPGSWLRARVVVDPFRTTSNRGAGPAPDAAAAATPARAVPSAGRAAFEKGNCGSAGAEAGLLSLLALLLLAARGQRRA